MRLVLSPKKLLLGGDEVIPFPTPEQLYIHDATASWAACRQSKIINRQVRTPNRTANARSSVGFVDPRVGTANRLPGQAIPRHDFPFHTSDRPFQPPNRRKDMPNARFKVPQRRIAPSNARSGDEMVIPASGTAIPSLGTLIRDLERPNRGVRTTIWSCERRIVELKCVLS